MNSAFGTTTTVQVDDEAQICAEAIGDRDDPAILLIGGATWSMDWWEYDLCRRLADRAGLTLLGGVALTAGGVAALAIGAVVLVTIPALWILRGGPRGHALQFGKNDLGRRRCTPSSL
jgi:hypothetical protein